MLSRNKKNALLNATGEAFWGFQTNMVMAATLLTVLLRAYGASAQMVGAIAAIETACMLAPQLLGTFIFRSRRNMKRNLVLWHIVFIAFFLLIMGGLTLFADDMSPAVYRWGMLATFVCFCLGSGIVMAAWLDWQAAIFAQNIRGSVIGVSIFASSFAGGAGALAAGWTLGHVQGPYSYAGLYIAAGVIGSLSILVFGLIDDPATSLPDVAESPKLGELIDRFRGSLSDLNFRAYLIGRFISACGFSIAPFIAVHYASERGGGLAGGTIVACGAAMTVGMALGSLIMGRLGDRMGHRLGVLIGVVVQTASLVILATVPGLGGCILGYFGAGVCSMGTWVAHSNMLIETCPHQDRMAHIAVGNLVLGVSTFGLPLLAGVVAERWGTVKLFEISIVFSVLALVWLRVKVKEPRDILASG